MLTLLLPACRISSIVRYPFTFDKNKRNGVSFQFYVKDFPETLQIGFPVGTSRDTRNSRIITE